MTEGDLRIAPHSDEKHSQKHSLGYQTSKFRQNRVAMHNAQNIVHIYSGFLSSPGPEPLGRVSKKKSREISLTGGGSPQFPTYFIYDF